MVLGCRIWLLLAELWPLLTQTSCLQVLLHLWSIKLIWNSASSFTLILKCACDFEFSYFLVFQSYTPCFTFAIHQVTCCIWTLIYLITIAETCDFSTGGVREALFGDEYYQVMWGKRSGFAKVALQAQVVSLSSSSYWMPWGITLFRAWRVTNQQYINMLQMKRLKWF